MNDSTPTRSLLLALTQERRTMREGASFLDEKCLLLAGEMLRELRRHRELKKAANNARRSALGALRAALMRHGLHGVQVAPPTRLDARLQTKRRMLLGVPLLDVALEVITTRAPAPVNPSPEIEVCRTTSQALQLALAALAASSSNLARLGSEYRRTVRRVRALQNVLLPDLDHAIGDIDTRLEDMEREDAVAMRGGAARLPAGLSRPSRNLAP